MKNRLYLSIILALLFSMSLTAGSSGFPTASTAVAAVIAPSATITKKTLYVGYSNYTIKFKSLLKDAKVTYKSSDKKIATVNSAGVIKPVAKGTATITISINQNKKSYTSKIVITVKNPSIDIVGGDKEYQIGATDTLEAKTYGIKKPSLKWTSSNKKVATIGEGNGKLTARASGETKITVTEKSSGKTDSITIKVKTASIPTTKPTPTPVPKPTVTPKPVQTTEGNITYKQVFSTGFEDGISGFMARGSETVEVIKNNAHTGNYSLKTSNRTGGWNGPIVDLTGKLEAGKSYQVKAWMKSQDTKPNTRIVFSIEKNSGVYMNVGSFTAQKDKWTEYTTTLQVPSDTTNIKLYFESADSPTADLFLDDMEVSEIIHNVDNILALPSLRDAYKDYFEIGMAVTDRSLFAEPSKTLIVSQFNTITMGNEMKPDSILDYETSISDYNKYKNSPAIKTANLEKYLKYAQDNGLKVRFHTLVWHSQTPRWFFTENYSKNASAPLVSKEVMLKRMENYIKQVMKCTSKYPGVIYAWDVVNEAIEPGDGKQNSYRSNNSLWYQVVGEEFVEKAFEYARKYSYDDAGLFYNDYNTYQPVKTTAIYNMASKLKAKGLIDGIGMQSHIDMGYPSLSDYEKAVRKFAELGLEIHVTELDMHNTQNTEAAFEQQAKRYGDLFEILIRLKKQGIANITNVTFWGLLDSETWLTAHRRATSYPLLFDADANPKPAFYSVLNAAKK